jgi:adenylate cyclase
MLITISWIIIGIMVETYGALMVDQETGKFFLFYPFGKSAWQHYLIISMGPLIGGTVGGSIIIFTLRDTLRKRSFAYKLIARSVIVLLLIFVAVISVGSIQALALGDDFATTFVDVVFTWRVFRLVVVWFFIVIATMFFLDISEKYGHGVLRKIITGKYHHPIVEERIFMFMDLTDSTALTERLGDEKYFELLRSLIFLATEPILNSEGEIYQYVGDEIILSWSTARGLRNANCIRSYFRVVDAIEKRKAEYLERFGVAPAFKSAVHMGNVVAGEIGVIKKDIVYSGDVLNSTARILSLSKGYGQPLLVTDQIYDKLKATADLKFELLDALVLRGKSSESKIYCVNRA